ncbi:MAG: hypothetical protein GY754_13970 [bacterium]|nr:hypothetical protein [bacterium]
MQPISLGGREAPNRLAAQAMEINSASTGGSVSPEVIDRYKALARGSWGLAFVEAISITPDSLARKNGLVLTRENLDGFKRLVEAYKKENETGLLLFQVTHSGRNSGDFSKKLKAYPDENTEVSPATAGDMERIRDQFITALALAREAGADGVDIKSCHGYFGSELLRPCNTRDDEFGGSRKNRARLLTSVLETGTTENPGLILGTRISLYEGIRGGCGTALPGEIIEDLDDMLNILDRVVAAGAQYLNISAGIPVVTPQLTRPEKSSTINLLHHFRYAKVVKDRFPGIPVMGSAYSAAREEGAEWAEENIKKGYVDFAGFGRQNLADPLFPKKIAASTGDVNYCTLCGGCSRLLKKQERVRCVLY